MGKKGISLTTLIVTIIIMVLLASIGIKEAMEEEGVIDETDKVVAQYNKHKYINDMRAEIEAASMRKFNTYGIRELEQEEITGIMERFGSYNKEKMSIVTKEGIEINIFEVVEDAMNKYIQISRENNILTVTNTLPVNGYVVQYTKDGGTTWQVYSQPVTYANEDVVYVRVVDSNNLVVSQIHVLGGNEQDKSGPQLTVNPMRIFAAKTASVKIDAIDMGESGLYGGNEYQYYLSTSATEQAGGSWRTYIPGEVFTVGHGLNGTYYLHVKSIKDNDNNESGVVVTNEYVFDNTAPTISLAVNGNSVAQKTQSTTIQITESAGVTYSYGWSVDATTPPTVWTSSTSKSQPTSQNTGDGNYYLWVKDLKDNAGNTATTSTVAGITSVNLVSNAFALDNTPPTFVGCTGSASTYYFYINDNSSGFDANCNVTLKSSYLNAEYVKNVTMGAVSDSTYNSISCKRFAVTPNTFTGSSINRDYIITIYVTLQDKAGNTSNSILAYSGAAYCFVEGTKVLTEIGLVNIEEIKVGDKVYSYNSEKGIIELKDVNKTTMSFAKTYKLEVENGEIIEGAGEHKVYVDGFGYKKIKDVKINDKLVNQLGEQVRVVNVVGTEELKSLYNIDVEGNRNYFVGEGMYLVEDLIETEVLKHRYNNFIYKITNAINNLIK